MRGIRPTALIYQYQPYSEWDELDFILIEAFQTLEDETSNSHGNPLWASRTMSRNVNVEVVNGVDIADQALAEWDEEHQGEKAEKGQTRVALMVDASGNPLIYSGLLREELMKATDGTLSSTTVEIDEGVEVEVLRPGQRYDPDDYGD